MPSARQLPTLLCSLYYLCFIFIFKHEAIQLIWNSDKRHGGELKKKKIKGIKKWYTEKNQLKEKNQVSDQW